MALEHFIFYLFVFLYGIIIGSFLNVCICRIPKEESIVTAASHCVDCNHKLAWYDLFPLFSWLFLRGRCRYCGARISVQYPAVEAANGLLYILVFSVNGRNADSALYCVMFSVLLVISVIDARTMRIPTGAEIILLLTGAVHLALHIQDWFYYVAGFAAVGLFLLLCAILFRAVTGKSGLGMGDVELMACAGLCIGWGHGLFAVIVGCVLGVAVEGIRILVTKKRGKFPFAPYLSAGIAVSALCGDYLYARYIQFFLS